MLTLLWKMMFFRKTLAVKELISDKLKTQTSFFGLTGHLAPISVSKRAKLTQLGKLVSGLNSFTANVQLQSTFGAADKFRLVTSCWVYGFCACSQFLPWVVWWHHFGRKLEYLHRNSGWPEPRNANLTVKMTFFRKKKTLAVKELKCYVRQGLAVKPKITCSKLLQLVRVTV